MGCSSQSTQNSAKKGDTITTSSLEKNSIRSNDSLLLAEIDTLFILSFEKMDTNSLVHLEKECIQSDGYLGEYFMVKMNEYYREETLNLVKILFEKPNSCLEKKLIEEWGMNVSVIGEKEKSNILAVLNFHKKSLSLEKKDFMKEMISKINPNKWN